MQCTEQSLADHFCGRGAPAMGEIAEVLIACTFALIAVYFIHGFWLLID